MKIVLLTIGKTSEKYLIEGFSQFQNRLRHYCSFEIIEIPNIKNAKNLSISELIKKEGKLILKTLKDTDYMLLLDKKGKNYSSVEFSKRLQTWMTGGKKCLVFVVGGSYDFSDEVYKRANEKLFLSKMTFSHQMMRLFFVEQLYRAYTILSNEPYHYD